MSDERSTHDRPVIVAGFDDSDSGRDAVALARVLAERSGALLLVANVYSYDVSIAPALALTPMLEDELRAGAEEVLAGAAPLLEGFDDWEPVALGDQPPARGLLGVAERRDADLIVVGTTHRHGLGRVMPGPTAAKLLHGAHCAIAIAPAGWSTEGSGTITLVGAGVDGSDESVAALRGAAGLAAALGARLRAIAVLYPPNPAHPWFAATTRGYTEVVSDLRADLRKRLDAAVDGLRDTVEVDRRVLDGNPSEVLARESEGLDLLVVGSRSYGAARSVLLGTVGTRLSSEARCPLIVVPRGLADPLRRLAVSAAAHEQLA